MIQHFTGVIEQEDDPRDYSVRLVGATQYPDEAIKECSVPNSDQKVGKCVMCPLEAAFTEFYGDAVGGNWGYGYFRTHKLSGMYPREAYSMAADYGLPLKRNDIAECEVTDVIDLANGYAPRIVPLAAERSGWTYAKLHSVDEVKAAIVQSIKTKGMRIAFATRVNTFGFLQPKNWMAYTDGGGGHMMMILGYGQHENRFGKLIEGVKVRNSWGEDWGDNGNCWMEWEDVLKRDEVYLLMPPAMPVEPEEPQIIVQRTLRLVEKPRMQGKDVKEAQTLLTEHGIKCDADGVFGPATDTAVRTFQKRKGLVVDGIVGAKTWAALHAEPEPWQDDTRQEIVEDMTDLMKMMVGRKYIIGAQGHALTQSYLDKRYKASPDYFTNGRYQWLCGEVAKADKLGIQEYCADCSGLFWMVANALNIIPGVTDSTADGLWRRYCTGIGKDDVRPGDILFRESGGRMTHMAVVGTDGVYEAAGTAYGVVFRPWADMFSRRTYNRMTGKFDTLKPWTHYGRLKALQ